MTIQEIEKKVQREYAGVFRTLETQICPTCNRTHGINLLERDILIKALSGAFLSGQLKGL